MKWVGSGLAALLLALPAARGDDPPKKEPPKEAKADPAKDEKKLSPRERYDALVKEVTGKQREILTEARKAGKEEQNKLFEKYQALPKQFAEQFYQLAEDHPKDPAGVDALFWLVQNAAGTPAHKTATEKVTALIAELPLKDVAARLARVRPNPTLMDIVLKRAEKDEKDPVAGDLVAWAATMGYFYPAGQKAADRLIEKYPDHRDVERVVALLGRAESETAEATLKKVLARDPKPKVKAAANLALARALANRTDSLGDKPAEADKVAAEAEKYFAAAIDLNKDSADQQEEIRREMKALHIRAGKAAPEIKGPDLDGKEFKLSDYRGKVVLLDFWGDW